METEITAGNKDNKAEQIKVTSRQDYYVHTSILKKKKKKEKEKSICIWQAAQLLELLWRRSISSRARPNVTVEKPTSLVGVLNKTDDCCVAYKPQEINRRVSWGAVFVLREKSYGENTHP